MGISELVFSSGSYKTTNPPISESSSTALEIGADGAVLTCKSTYNGAEGCKKFNVPQAEVDGLLALFAQLGVKAYILNAIANPPPPMPPYMGGMESSAFSFTENGESLEVNSVDGAVLEFVNRLCSLQQSCGAPFFEQKPPQQEGAAFGMAAPVSVQQPAAPSPAQCSWYCPNCGAPNNGRFCTECGTPKL